MILLSTFSFPFFFQFNPEEISSENFSSIFVLQDDDPSSIRIFLSISDFPPFSNLLDLIDFLFLLRVFVIYILTRESNLNLEKFKMFYLWFFLLPFNFTRLFYNQVYSIFPIFFFIICTYNKNTFFSNLFLDSNFFFLILNLIDPSPLLSSFSIFLYFRNFVI